MSEGTSTMPDEETRSPPPDGSAATDAIYDGKGEPNEALLAFLDEVEQYLAEGVWRIGSRLSFDDNWLIYLEIRPVLRAIADALRNEDVSYRFHKRVGQPAAISENRHRRELAAFRVIRLMKAGEVRKAAIAKVSEETGVGERQIRDHLTPMLEQLGLPKFARQFPKN